VFVKTVTQELTVKVCMTEVRKNHRNSVSSCLSSIKEA